jgi:hypothetical protein
LKCTAPRRANSPLVALRGESTTKRPRGPPKSWEIFGRELKLAAFPSDTGKLGQYVKPAMDPRHVARAACELEDPRQQAAEKYLNEARQAIAG